MRKSKVARALDQTARVVTGIGLSYKDGQEVPVARGLKVTVHGTPGTERTVKVTTTNGREIGTLNTDANGIVQR